MTNASLSNRSERTSAIFKTIGIYLFTLLLVILAVWSDREQAGSNEDMNDQIQALQQDTTHLNELIRLTDTIASLSLKRANYNEQNQENPGSVSDAEFSQLKLEVNAFHERMDKIKRENLRVARQFDSLYNIYDVLERLIAKLKISLALIEKQKKEYANQTAEGDLRREREILAEEQEKLNQARQGGNELQTVNENLRNKTHELDDLQDQFDQLNEKFTTVETEIENLRAYLKDELSESRIGKNWKPVVERSASDIETMTGIIKN